MANLLMMPIAIDQFSNLWLMMCSLKCICNIYEFLSQNKTKFTAAYIHSI